MATWKSENSMLTLRGVEILNNLKAGLGSITITRIVAGSGRVPESQLYNQTNVSGSTKNMTVDIVHTTSTGSEISMYITNEGFTSSFELHQIGIFVKYSNDKGEQQEEQLYHISQCEEDSFDDIPAISDSSITLGYSLFLEHGNSSEINLTVDPSGMVTAEVFNAFKKDVLNDLGEVSGSVSELSTSFNSFKTSLLGTINSFRSGLKEGKLVTSDKNNNLIASGKNTVSGTSFSVTDAITHRALSLSIEGKSTQSTTPKPSAPVYLVNSKVSYIRNSDGGSVNSKLISFPSGVELRSLGNYKDTIEWDGAKWWKVQRIQELVLDGVDNKVYSSDGVVAGTYCNFALSRGYYNLVKDHISSAPIMTSHGNATHPNETAEFYAFHYSSSSAICGHFLNTLTGVTSAQTRDEKGNTINAWLKAQSDAGTPVKVWYVLKTPIVTEISITEVLEMYDTKTSITCTAEGNAPNMVLSYALNTTDDTIMYILKSLARKSDVQVANTFAAAELVEEE